MAALGGDLASVQADQAALNASLQITAANGYTVHELQTTAGMVIREYVADGGQVFAVAWQGPRLPDLRRLMGNYFDQYTSAAQAQQGSHGHLAIHGNDLVVESSGRMRMFFGRAYLSQALPDGVTAAEIQ